jgi:hypothetical protein
MNITEYARYEAAVKAFMAREGIANLTSGHHECPDCKQPFDDAGICPECHADRECLDEASFSWGRCDCCGTTLGGDRLHATGYNPTTREIYEYSICTDCDYYSAYGHLDDTTMMEVEASA